MEKLSGAAASLQLKEDRTGNITLHEAVLQKNYKKVKSLLSSGVDVNCQDEDGYTPLHMAVIKDCTDIAQLLMNTPAIKINQGDRSGLTPLHRAAVWSGRGSVAMVKLLIAGGADPNVRDCYDYTPLHVAVYWGDTEVVAVLLSRPETDLSIVNDEGLTALEVAKRGGHRAIIEMLGSHASPVPGDRAAGGTMEQSVCPPCKVNKATNTSTPCQINKATNTSTPCQINKANNTSTLCRKCCSTIEHCPQCGMNVCTVDEFRSQQINVKVLLKVAKTLVRDWFKVGIQLEVPAIELDKINCNNPNDVDKQASLMLLKWCDISKPEECTIATLEEALKTVDCFEALRCLDSEEN